MDFKYPPAGQAFAPGPTYVPTAGSETKQTQGVQGASKWTLAGLTLLHATKALVTQGVAFGVVIGGRMMARELLEAARAANEEEAGTALILTTAVLATCAFDQLVTKRATSMLYGWAKGKYDGKPADPVGWKTGAALALVPTALSVALVVREVVGASSNQDLANLVTDVVTAGAFWRGGRVLRDVGQQIVNPRLPKLAVVDMDTGKPLTTAQKKTFDDLRLACQLGAYGITIISGAWVFTPGLREYLGHDERADSASARFYAMLAPMVFSVLAEAADEGINVIAHCLVAQRQDRVVTVGPAERPKDMGKAILDQGSMRAFMGVFVTDLAQLILSIDRGSDFFKALGTAIGSIAITIMEIRAKSVGVQSGVRDTSQAFKELSDELIRIMQSVTKIEVTGDQRNAMRAAIKAARDRFVEGGWGTHAVQRTEQMTMSELTALALSTVSDNTPRGIDFDVTPEALVKLQRDKEFKPESADQARRLLHLGAPALPLLRALNLGKFPGVETKSPDVQIDIKAPSGMAQPASTNFSQPTSPAGSDQVPLMNSIDDDDGAAFDTKGKLVPVPEEGSETFPAYVHPSPIKVPPSSPREEREKSGNALPACEVFDRSGRRWTEPPPLGSEVTIQRVGLPLLRGAVADRGPQEDGFVYIATAHPGDLTHYGEVVDPGSFAPLLKVRIADVG